MFLAVKGNWKAYMNFICISMILCLICDKLMSVNKLVATFTSKQSVCAQQNSFQICSTFAESRA